jgi:hypothetical protein
MSKAESMDDQGARKKPAPARRDLGGGERLSQRALNRATLARQMMLRRTSLPALDAVVHLAGMQAQNPLDPYFALWSRLENFQPTELADLLTSRRVVRAALMRTTIHLVSAEDCLRIRPAVQHILERVFGSTPFARNIKGVDYEALLALGRTALTERPLTGPALARILAEQWPEHEPASLAYAVRYIVPLVQIPPRGVWGSGGQATWATVEAWLGQPVGGETAPDWLVPRYLAAFGPASVMDMQNWSGLTKLAEVFERWRPNLRTFRNEDGVELFDLPEAPRPDPETPAPVRFCPEYDNLLLGHADRTRLIPLDRRGRYVTGNAFLVDGLFSGAWKLRRGKEMTALEIDPFVPLASQDEASVLEEAGRLLAFAAPGQSHDVRFTVVT